MSSQDLLGTLKRPRSTSRPPSPSSGSSPKRAASEDPFPSSSDSGRVFDHLITDNGSMVAASSPLRQDIGDNESNKSWVELTQQVKLGSDGEEDMKGDTTLRADGEPTLVSQEIWKERNNELLGLLPPPFNHYERYYILPKSIVQKVQLLALSDADDTAVQPEDFAEAMEKLVPDHSAETFWVIQSEETTAGHKLIGKAKKEDVWVLGDVEENEDYVFVPEAGWQKVLEWFGPYDGPSLPRYCVPPDNIEIIPANLRLFIVFPADTIATTSQPDESIQSVLLAPSTTPIKTFENFAVSVCNQEIDSSRLAGQWATRLWKIEKSGENDESLLKSGSLEITPKALISTKCELIDTSNAEENLAEAILGNSKSQIVAIEFGKIPEGSSTPVWNVEVNSDKQAIEKSNKPAPLFSKPAFFSGSGKAATESASTTDAIQRRSQTKERKGKGLVGLQNLGNTCFMNSAVQCLSNTKELSQYFLSGVYTDELNRDNPLGMQGQIAEAFGQVVENLWAPSSSMHSSYSPRQLKWTTSRFAPQFAGYGQHDTQEFIAFLLDGLHEDLNRILKKPYIEKPDWKPGGGDKELAELGKECWDGYKKRNDSVIVDLFQGQLKSTLVCPECHKESITFDPFMYLTVPLPIAQNRQFKVTFVPRDIEKPPVIVKLLISQNASFAQVKDKLGSLFDCKGSSILGFDLWNNRPYAWWADSDHNSEAKDTDEVIFYELEPSVSVSVSRGRFGSQARTFSQDGSLTVPVYTFRTVESSRGGYRAGDVPSDLSLKPFFITLTKDEASDPVAVREAIMRGYARFIKPHAKENIYVPAFSAEARAPTPPKSDDGESVTVIHMNDDQATVVEVPSSQQSSADISTPVTEDASMEVDSAPSPTAVTGLQLNGSTTSLLSTQSIKSSTSSSGKLVPRADLFRVYVADPAGDFSFKNFRSSEKKNDAAHLYDKDITSASRSWSLLESRKKKAKKHIVNRLASGISSMVNPSHNSEDEALSDASTATSPSKIEKKKEKLANSKLVVRPGEGIFCEWSGADFAEWLNDNVKGEDVIDPAISKDLAKKREGKHIGIEDCLDEFSKEETLGQDDLWYCPVCKKHQAATKKLEIYKAPDILVICIKRFGSSRRMGDKLDNLVHFPIDGLDLEDRIGERQVAKTLKLSGEDIEAYGIEDDGEPLLYDLYAVDNHFGGMGGGHYTAFCRNQVDNQWYNYDDSRVSKADVSSVQSRAAYLLFYRRRTSRPIGGESRIKAEEASRNVASAPASPDAGAPTESSTMPSTAFVSARTTPTRELSPDLSSDELPSYSQVPSPPTLGTSAPPSPTVSDDSFPAPETYSRGVDIASVGQSIGFGNTAWGTSAKVLESGHSFGTMTRAEWLDSPAQPVGMERMSTNTDVEEDRSNVLTALQGDEDTRETKDEDVEMELQ
ncbi:ubiquitin carboxyl-terminal hydrolase 4/11/15 [Cryptococcus deuterogattii R265]|uniref:ubiquitin carboxyl-terminal hydrolase 4/11/15 n=1 Tax=Cryptococcus deuterogattii (strain R265) TaxID=294750 RepID=UPI0005B5FA9A|nr:ubiquitin carboxyl-terminal hydrolase 4/11/15 [Cryptococcus deuterogattii LA55]KIR73127.1 ubiquitin carboxyl-terminal hydrolase 4/11/15 [Cryptococcus deuterogattii CA1014]KIR90096.1 ubiquitin carboxyl-terminal hydrolase 4/11/15 [Cryptococcus deuterogattii CBS 10090]KNX50100.2 ubiquitin carboxyl-terminal hydrolase 4/11/15 [Cryptococcus deuterogattii R265]